MENTGNALLPEFKDDRPEWYITEGEQWIGPLSARDVYKKVLDREITLAHYVWRPGQAGWERICDLKVFQGAVPQLPPKNIQKEVKEAVKDSAAATAAVKEPAKPAVKAATRTRRPPALEPEETTSEATFDERVWFLHYNDSQFGPFSELEVSRFIAIGKVNGKVFAWRDGMDSWKRLEEVAEFRKTPPARKPTISKAEPLTGGQGIRVERTVGKESRQEPRRPLVAKILMASENALVVGVCRDISVGGLQVLTDKVPGPVGSRVKLNVSSTGDDKKTRITPFVAEGVIVRILEDGRGFSFRFDRLGDSARRAIEAYIRSND
ncbi:MAG: GYF domain-containing protein [Oligoflexia bacterium]|nr:GYF domain-containing protein [Oligoflexia bacterium]